MKPNLIVCALAFASQLSAGAYTVVTDEHVDLRIEYVGGSLRGKIYSHDDGSIERNAGLLYDGPSGTTRITRPGSSTWDFIGVGAGETFHYWPHTSVVGRIFLGFGSDFGSIPGGTLASYYESDERVDAEAAWTKITLAGMRYAAAPGESGTAHFSLWQIDSFGDAVVWMSTAEGGITSTDATWLIEGGHSHFNWGFTKRGHYELDFKFSGYLNGSNTYIESAAQTFHFGVEFQPAAIPEPSSATLLVLAMVASLARRLRRADGKSRRAIWNRKVAGLKYLRRSRSLRECPTPNTRKPKWWKPPCKPFATTADA